MAVWPSNVAETAPEPKITAGASKGRMSRGRISPPRFSDKVRLAPMAPMALTTYEEVRPWARSMKTRVSQRQMPPWHIDRTVGIRHYKNDLSLTDEEVATVLKWADNGAR